MVSIRNCFFLLFIALISGVGTNLLFRVVNSSSEQEEEKPILSPEVTKIIQSLQNSTQDWKLGVPLGNYLWLVNDKSNIYIKKGIWEASVYIGAGFFCNTYSNLVTVKNLTSTDLNR
jgi:hypothetical protein